MFLVFVSESSDYNSDDDFIVSDDEDSRDRRTTRKKKKHCNTALLIGPCGSGKTAAVYAVADELGFKVCVIIIWGILKTNLLSTPLILVTNKIHKFCCKLTPC